MSSTRIGTAAHAQYGPGITAQPGGFADSTTGVNQEEHIECPTAHVPEQFSKFRESQTVNIERGDEQIGRVGRKGESCRVSD